MVDCPSANASIEKVFSVRDIRYLKPYLSFQPSMQVVAPVAELCCMAGRHDRVPFLQPREGDISM